MSSEQMKRIKRFQVARKRAASAARQYLVTRDRAERTPSRRATAAAWALHTRAVILGRVATSHGVFDQPWPTLVAAATRAVDV